MGDWKQDYKASPVQNLWINKHFCPGSLHMAWVNYSGLSKLSNLHFLICEVGILVKLWGLNKDIIHKDIIIIM